MKKIKIIFLYLCLGLSFLVRGQAIGNYVNNGSFEQVFLGSSPPKAKDWEAIDSTSFFGMLLTKTLPPNQVPLSGFSYQWPKHGDNYFISSLFFNDGTSKVRGYPKNALKSTLKPGGSYCVNFYCNVTNNSTHGLSALGAYFGDSSIDTISYCTTPLTYLTPQVLNPNGNYITDTLNWVAVGGTFVATGTEKYMLIGNFMSDNTTDTVLINPTYLPTIGVDFFYDAISCIEIDLPAYAGPDKSVILGDSVYIGRESDFAIDPGCIWYKLPNMTTSLDTVSGIWVKPTTTSTYVVRQVLDCSSLKWDTVVVTINTNLAGLDNLKNLSDNINLFPNPTSGNLNISFAGSVHADIIEFSIIDNLGQIIREDEINLKNSSFIVSTSDLTDGLYQINFKTQFGSVTKKFVKIN